MIVKNSVEFSFEREGKFCRLICDSDAQLGFLYDAVSQIKSYLIERMDAENKKAAEESMEDYD